MNLFYEAKKVLDKDGKVNPLGPYGKQKLTGREIQVYFRRNKVKDKVIKKAVEVALDLGGAMDIAIKSIKDYYGDKVLKTKEVQTALKFANEESFRDSFDMLDEDYKKVIKMYPRDRDWKKLITKHKRAIDSLRKNDKDLPKKVEDELLTWASQTGEVGSKDDAEDFIMSIIDEGTLTEGKNLMPDIQKIVDTKGAAKVGGIMIDMFTASMISQIYNKVNDSNKKKMEKSNISTLVDIAQRIMQKNSVQEGTMSIGIFDRKSSEKKKAIAGMQKLLKGKQNVKVGSPEGQKIGDELDMKYLSDDELADDFIKPSNKNMTISQLLKKHEKRLGLKFKEEVEEAVSPAQQAAIAIAKKKKNESVMDSYRQMWESENLEEKKEFKQNDIDKVAKLTDRNEHTKSLIHIAKSMGDKKSVKKLELIDKLHNEYGHMSMELGKLRNEIYDDLKKDMEKYSNGKDMYNAT